MISRSVATTFVISCTILAITQPAEARKSKVKPELTLKVRKGKKVIGTEKLQVRDGETDEEGVQKFYFSTKSRLNDAGRRFGFRTHTVLNAKGKLLTYDRWIDVKGATLRRRVFAFKGVWKHVTFAQRGRKNDLIDLKLTGPIIVLDPRSPTLVSMAVDRLIGKGETHYVNVETGKTGKLTMTAEHLADTAGKHYIRYHLKGRKINVSALRDDQGDTLHVKGLSGYGGQAKTFKPMALQPAAAPETAGTPTDKDAPIPPPSVAPKADKTHPADSTEKTEKTAGDAKPAPKNPAPAKSAAAAKPKKNEQK